MVRGPSRRAFGKLSPSSGQAELECFRRNRLILRNLSAAASALALAACAVGPAYKAPQSASPPAATGAFVSANSPDRKRVVDGTLVSVRVDLGGRRLINKTTINNYT